MTDQEISKGPRPLVSFRIPTKDGRTSGIRIPKKRDHDEIASSEGYGNAAPARKDHEILDELRGSIRRKLDFDGENRNPFRKAKASGLWETDFQHYERLSVRFGGIEGVSPVFKDTPDGSIVFDKLSGALHYRESNEAKWQRAVFHHWIRDEISEVENGRGDDAENLEYGLLNGDITCFSSSKRRPSNPARSSVQPGNLRYNGILVIDYGLSSVRAFCEFPLVLSSEYAGASIIAAQLQNSVIELKDFRARMPPVIQEKIEGKLVLKPLYSIETIAARVHEPRDVSQEAADATTQPSGAYNKTPGQSMTEDNDRQMEAENAKLQQDRTLTKSAPPDFVPEDQDDGRNLSPITAHEALALWEALHATADHFLQLTGREALRNEDRPAPNYCAQWMDMQNQLRQIWESTPPAPSLVSRGRWTGGIANWASGELSFMLGEL